MVEYKFTNGLRFKPIIKSLMNHDVNNITYFGGTSVTGSFRVFIINLVIKFTRFIVS